MKELMRKTCLLRKLGCLLLIWTLESHYPNIRVFAEERSRFESLPERTQARVACFRGLLEALSKGERERPQFYLVLESGEEKLIETAFSGHLVRPASECRIKPGVGVVNKTSGEKGVLLEI